MIQTSYLLNAIKDRVQDWTYSQSYKTKKQALKAAAKLFVKETGVVIQKGDNGFRVLSWHPKRRTQNDI